MCTKPVARFNSAFTLVETMVAVSILTICVVGLGSLFIFSARGFAAMENYAVLDQFDRQTMDQVTRELRQAKELTDYQSNAVTRSITFTSGDDGTPITYTFDSNLQQFRRTGNGTTKVLLNHCSLLNFSLYLRPPPTSTSFDLYPVVMEGANWQKQVKVVQLSWKTSLQICPTPNINSEDIQTACVVIRKQQDD